MNDSRSDDAIERNRATLRAILASRDNVVKRYGYEVVRAVPHDRSAFTQGLIYRRGSLIESTGIAGRSSLCRLDPDTGAVRQRVDVPSPRFAEGLTELRGQIFQLTWRDGVCLVYDADSLRLDRELPFAGESWGVTTDGDALIVSDGTDRIRWVDPRTLDVRREIHVTANGSPLTHLNELEFVDGEIWANIWPTNFIARIGPETGAVLGVVDLSSILPKADQDETTNVLNGTAHDAATGRLFVTGKHWPTLFEIRVVRSALALAE